MKQGWLFRCPHTERGAISLPPTHLSQEHSCVINIGVGKNLDMLNNLIDFLDPVFAEHLSEWTLRLLQQYVAPPPPPPGQA